MVLDLVDFTKQQSLSFGYILGSKLIPPASGLNFVNKDLNTKAIVFSPLYRTPAYYSVWNLVCGYKVLHDETAFFL